MTEYNIYIGKATETCDECEKTIRGRGHRCGALIFCDIGCACTYGIDPDLPELDYDENEE